ncbi:antibiotic biosynthesis monooxygenase [Microbacterium ulmi]|uniref:Antibiotic biosynthesis monooxygenase n=1 Tax=Microbacterium ulmi TaxID=179095 RepID=A0A7Y2M164_9MICO|nr:quinol monooxygenase YgiN [Microbacterium ulmi]NNH04605.1 antibiotic biosynthesis monooxygenase [Microbacterium ulmi]
MSDSIVVLARLYPAEGRQQDLLDAIAPTFAAIHAEEGCQLFAAHSASDGTVVLIEKWESRAALDAHGRGGAVRALRSARAEFEARPAQVELLTPSPPGATAKGRL